MAARLQGDFYSYLGDLYQITLDDADFVGSAIDFNISSLKFRWDPVTQELFTPIITTSCSIVLKVTSSAIESVLDDLITAEEGRFRITIDKGGNLYWIGYVLADQIIIQDRPVEQEYDFTLNAVDGIAKLKDIDYNDSGTAYSGKETYMNHILEILGKIGLDDFFGGGDDYLTCIYNWYTNVHAQGSNFNPLLTTRFGQKALTKIDRNGLVNYMTTFDVLQMLAKSVASQLIWSEGTYVWRQPNEYDNAGNVNIFKSRKTGGTNTYTADAALSSITAETGNVANFQSGSNECVTRSGGSFQFFPPLNKVEVTYNHFSTRNLIEGVTWSDSDSTTTTVEDLDYNGGTVTLAFRGFLEATIDFTTFPAPYLIKFGVTIKVGTYYLRRDGTFNANQVSYTDAEWTTTGSDYEVYTTAINSDNTTIQKTIEFITPLLIESGDFEISFNIIHVIDVFGNVRNVTEYTDTYTLSNNYVEVLINGTLDRQYDKTLHTVNNSTTGNSAKIEFETLTGIGPTNNVHGAIEGSSLWPTNWAYATGFLKPGGSAKDMNDFLVEELINPQLAPVKKMVGRIHGPYEAHYKLKRNGENYIFLGGEFDVKTDEWDGTWAVIDVPATGEAAESPIEVITIDSPFNDAGGITEETEPDTPFAPQQWESVSTLDTEITQGGAVTSIDTPLISNDFTFVESDQVLLSDPLTGLNQDFEVSGNVNNGDSAVSVTSENADYTFPVNSVLTLTPEWQNVLIQYSRLRYVTIPHLDSSTVLSAGTLPFYWGTYAFTDRFSKIYLTRISYDIYISQTGTSVNFDINFRNGTAGTIQHTASGLTGFSQSQRYNLTTSPVELTTGVKTWEIVINSGSFTTMAGLTAVLEILTIP